MSNQQTASKSDHVAPMFRVTDGCHPVLSVTEWRRREKEAAALLGTQEKATRISRLRTRVLPIRELPSF